MNEASNLIEKKKKATKKKKTEMQPNVREGKSHVYRSPEEKVAQSDKGKDKIPTEQKGGGQIKR